MKKPSTRVITLKRNEAIGQFDLFAGFDEAESEASLSIRKSRTFPNGRKRTSSPSNGTCTLYVSDHPLQGLEGS